MSQSICNYCDGRGHTESKCQLKRHQQRVLEYNGRMCGVICPNCQLCGHIAKTCQLQPTSLHEQREIHRYFDSRGRIKKLIKTQAPDLSGAFSATECPVCWDELQLKTTVVLKCKHMMCKSCKPRISSCPLCRVKI